MLSMVFISIDPFSRFTRHSLARTAPNMQRFSVMISNLNDDHWNRRPVHDTVLKCHVGAGLIHLRLIVRAIEFRSSAQALANRSSCEAGPVR
jgi:hypothetical protein